MSVELALGSTFAGFRIERALGRGAMGAVYLGEDVHLRRKVAANRDVIGVVGPLESSCAGIEIPILNRPGPGPLALVSPSNSQVALTRPDRFAFPPGAPAALYPTRVRNYARVFAREDQQAAANALLARDLGRRRVFVLDDREPYGQGMASHFRATARRIGLRLAGTASWDPQGHGLGPLARRVQRAHPDAVFLGGVLSSAGADLVRALRARLGQITLMAPDAFAPVWGLWDQAGPVVRGMYITTAACRTNGWDPRGAALSSSSAGHSPAASSGLTPWAPPPRPKCCCQRSHARTGRGRP